MSRNENRPWAERAGQAYVNTDKIVYANSGTVLTPTGSVKHDADKPALQYVPREAMEAMGYAFAYGAKKYGGNNYKLTGLELTRCLGAALRHVYAKLGNEDKDPESGVDHLGHAMAAIAMAIYMEHNHPIKNDIFKK